MCVHSGTTTSQELHPLVLAHLREQASRGGVRLGGITAFDVKAAPTFRETGPIGISKTILPWQFLHGGFRRICVISDAR
jgi:hypothetical protein